MITFNLKNFRLSLTFGFFFVMAMTTLRDNRLGTMSLLFCIAHELGHLITMRLFGVKIQSLRFYGAGIKITSDAMDTLTKPVQALIYLAGPLTNLILAAFLCDDLAALNLSLAVFNLLPISYFDGGKLVSLILSERGAVLRTLSLLSYTALAALIAYTAYQNPETLSPSSIMTFVFIAISCIFDS